MNKVKFILGVLGILCLVNCCTMASLAMQVVEEEVFSLENATEEVEIIISDNVINKEQTLSDNTMEEESVFLENEEERLVKKSRPHSTVMGRAEWKTSPGLVIQSSPLWLEILI